MYKKEFVMRKVSSFILICVHFIAFAGIRDARAFSMTGTTIMMPGATIAQAGESRAGVYFKISQDSLGESCVGKSQSSSFFLEGGYIPTIKSDPPSLIGIVPNQSWQENATKTGAFDLDDYFSSLDGYTLNYSVTGNQKINVAIEPQTHLVSFSQPQGWFGTETIKFKAQDEQGNYVLGNEISLQVEGMDNSPVLSFLADIVVDEGDEVVVSAVATDLDNDEIAYSFSAPLNAEGRWQTDFDDAGIYNVKVSATDASGLIASQNFKISVKNVNRAPSLFPLDDITVSEGQLVLVVPQASDADGDAMTFYFSSPLDSNGRWQTYFNDAGIYPYSITVSDGIDTVTGEGRIVVNNFNRPPEISILLSQYTVDKETDVIIHISGTDPDSDSMIFVLKKDGQELASGNLAGIYETSTSFSTSGDHVISVMITDAFGLKSESSAGIDVVDPNVSSNLIFPIMGDFNGDALGDIGLYNGATGLWEVSLSERGVFRGAVDWLQAQATSLDISPVAGDFNGDAKTDAGLYDKSTGVLRIALSSGDNFSTPAIWLDFSENPSGWLAFSGNFNGDRYSDFGLYNKDTGEARVALGNGTGFNPFFSWLTGFGTGYSVVTGDFNGDSLTDICLVNKTAGEYKVALSNGRVFVDGRVWISGFGTGEEPVPGDYNNDGLLDIGYWDRSALEWHYAVSSEAGFIEKDFWRYFGASSDEFITTGDFNGDGIMDSAAYDHELSGILRWKTEISNAETVDLLNSIDNGTGGRTEIIYSHASVTDNPGLPFPVNVASEIKLVDTLPIDASPEVYIQQFTFSDGYYDAFDREFRGFGKIKALDPITGNSTETYFYQGKPGQDGALKGQIEKTLAYDGSSLTTGGKGRLVSCNVNIYEVRKAGPADRVLGFPALVRQETTVWEENDSYLSIANEMVYDSIGNVLETKNIGDLAYKGDEKSTQIVYALAYENGFCRPIEIRLKDKNGVVIKKKNFEYDAKGNLIKTIVPIYNPLTGETKTVVSASAYDNFGNLISGVNAKNISTTTEYESVFNTFPSKTTNSFGHNVDYFYDTKSGLLIETVDPNGNSVKTFYDSLGRLISTLNAYGETTMKFYYPDFNTKISRQGNLEKAEYIDGLGRKYKVVSSGEDGPNSRQVSSEIYYNNRGQVDRESVAHYIDEDEALVSYTRYEYDTLGRVRKTILDFSGIAKDTVSELVYISPLYTESIDPMGRKKGLLKDVYGNITKVSEFAKGGVYKTDYFYDIQNNLLKVTDAAGNISEIWYDSEGRKIKIDDPDMGIWLYEYDLLGNLTKQIDANGGILNFEYDELNRLIKKSVASSMHGLVEYFYDEVGKENCFGRLSKIMDDSGSTEFFYDKSGREIKSIKTVSGQVYQVQREYDVYDRLSKLVYPDGEAVNYSYDSNSGFLDKIYNSTDSTNYVNSIDYNAQGQMKTITYGNNVTTRYSYGQDLRLTQILTSTSALVLQNMNYVFDKNGNMTTLSDNLRSNVRSYIYDDMDRLIEAQNTPDPRGGNVTIYYQYDPIGNITYKSDLGMMSYGFNVGPHALTSAAGYSYQYDANGNMVSGKNKILEYDVENRIIKILQPSAVTTFVYDGGGGRVRKNSTNSITQQTQDTVYVGSIFEINNDFTDSGNQITQIKHIFAGMQKICSVNTTNSKHSINYYHSDHLGSSSIITDENGNQAAHYEYTPYGSIAVSEVLLFSASNYLFNGKELDQTGLYFYGARYYDPDIARFVTPDTIVQAPHDSQSLNRYSYCRNNPVNYIDPTGHFWWFAALIFAAKAAAVVSIGTAIAGGIAYAAGNANLASTFFQISQYSGYSSAVAGLASFAGAVMKAASTQVAISGSSLALGFAEEAAIDLGTITVTSNASMAIGAAWEVTKDAVMAGVAGTVSAIGSAAVQVGALVGGAVRSIVSSTSGYIIRKASEGFSWCPRYGNWGGIDWSGGTQIQPGQIGPNALTIDQMDGYFKEHDFCCYGIEKSQIPLEKRMLRAGCDSKLYDDLLSLPGDPLRWNPPARRPYWARWYKKGAEMFFGSVSGGRSR
ncbi:MAG: RHS repeat-associated core domain-containing protein [Candidatus Omnitrophota bacterium]